MGKITKEMQPKHRETLSPWLKSYVESTSTTPLPLLPGALDRFPTRWPFGRGDLYHWIPLLNRFDAILESFCTAYKLRDGPQARDFACDVLLNGDSSSGFSGEKQWDPSELSNLGFPPDGDRTLVEAILRFTRVLLECCGNRSIYASSAHLNDILNSTSLSLIIATLEVGSELAQRYQASVKRIGNASRQISTALLANHYNIDLDRVQQLALPFVKTPIITFPDPTPTTTPSSASKRKDALQHGSAAKNAAASHANDLVALVTADDRSWNGWGDIKLSYYPSEPVPSAVASTDAGRSSLPSTPTPLRRSTTMTTPHHTPRNRNASGDDSSPIGPRTPALVDETATSGQKTFEIPQNIVLSTPADKLLSRCPAEMPAASRYEVFHRIRAAKALLSSRKTRQQLLAVRLLAITNLAFIQPETTFVEKVLRQDVDETRKYQLVYQLADLIHPSSENQNEVPLSLQTISLGLLEAISGFHARCQDVLSALNANVNHGILLYVIRKAVANMREGDGDNGDRVTEADEWRSNLFSLTLHLAMSTRVGTEMVAAGLMDILVDMLKARSNVAQRYHSMVLAFLDNLIWTYQNAFTTFFNADGLEAISQLFIDTVQESKQLCASGQGIRPDQQSSTVDYEVPYHRQQTLKWLSKFVHHIMSNSYTYSGNTDRLLRNLAEKSDLLSSLREIIEDKKTFGSIVWTNSVTILSHFINNDPTSFAAISESGMVTSFLAAITGKPLSQDLVKQSKEPTQANEDEGSPDIDAITALIKQDNRPHPPTEPMLLNQYLEPSPIGILPSADAINIVPQVLNAISLNNLGMKMVIQSKSFDSFFQVFTSAAHVKCLEIDHDLASTVGGSFDELARHHPALRSPITNAVIDMVARVRFFGLEKARSAGWGARLFVNGADGKMVSVTEKGQLQDASDLSGKGKEVAANGETDVDMSDAVSHHEMDGDNGNESKGESPADSFTPYVHALASFLSQYVSNSILKMNFIEYGGIEMLLDISESPALSAKYGESMAHRIMNNVLVQLIETSPGRGLPSLLHRAQASIDTLEPLTSKTEAVPPYFAPFLSSEVTADPTSDEALEVIRTGTKLVKALLNSQTLIKIITDCFTAGRSNTLQFYRVNVYDYYLKLVKSMGPMLRGVLAEEAGQLTVIPSHWSPRRQAPESGGAPVGTTNGEPDENAISDVLNTTDSWKGDNGTHDATESRLSDSEQCSPRYRNYETLRLLLHPTIPTTFPFFQSLGKALLPRRDPHHNTFNRSRHLEIARALADTVLGHLAPSVATPEPATKDFHYWIIMLHTIHEMLIEHPTSRTNDRSSVQLIMPVLLAFKEEKGLEVLNSMLTGFSTAVREGPADANEGSSRPKVAAYGLKKILDLYLVLVNGKYLTESSNQFGLHKTDRSKPGPVIYQQIVVEFRAAILPAVTSLWRSSLIEKLSDSTVKRVVDILKMVATGDNEPQSAPKDKTPFMLFNHPDVRFDWRSSKDVVENLLNSGYNVDLVHEAVYRTNGDASAAQTYCRSYNANMAGPRNPIPPEDSDISALSDSSSAMDRQPSNATSNSDADRMSLDGPPEIPREILGDFVDRSSQALDDLGVALDTAGPSADQAGPSNAAEASSEPGQSVPKVATKEDLDKMREDMQNDLDDRCLDVIRAHPDTAIEISELITAMALKQQTPAAYEKVGATVAFALSSLALEDEDKQKNGKCIAAYAHLLALLLQDERFFDQNIDTLREKIDEYTGLLKVTPSSSEELPPWIPFVLLILETMLCRDERPIAAQWTQPKTLEEDAAEPVITTRTPLVSSAERVSIIESLLELLPRVGKDDVLATSVLRTLIILSREHSHAKIIGDKKSLQRLFLMAKQLASFGAERLKQTKLTTYIMVILRHIVEDDEIIKQYMRAEITAEFPNISRNHRGQPDVMTYLRALAPLALRNTKLFVEVTNETLKFSHWNPQSNEVVRSQPLAMKEPKGKGYENGSAETDKSDAPADVKPSTETTDKDMQDVQKQTDIKRPVVENPDGVIHFLLCELVNYRDVDDKEPSTGKEKKDDTESAKPTGASSSEALAEPDKKQSKPVFKAEEHPIFVYKGFLLNCLTELLQSYNRAKMEFINFKRSAPPPSSSTPVKPRSSVLNHLIYDLLCQGNLSGTTDTIASKKKAAISVHTQKVLVALVSKTSEKLVDRSQDKYVYDGEPDLLFVRKFVLDTILKAYERAPLSDEPLETRYSRMQSLAELMNHMVGEKDKEHGSSTRGADNNHSRSQAPLRRLMLEKGYLDKLTSSISEINLNYPGVKRAIKYILRVLRVLTDTAKELSYKHMLPSEISNGHAKDGEDENMSTSSLSDLDDDREETPDLYRNSTLGLLEPRGEDDESEDEDEEDDEDMYGDEYDDEEMDYGDEGEDNISDDDEEGLSEMGEIEGLHGDPGVVEVVMDEDDDDDDDEDDDSEDDDDDDPDSADMDDLDDQVEIFDEDGNPLDDDGGSDWESDVDEDEEGNPIEGDDLDYEAEVQDEEEAHIHGMDPGDLLDNMARAMLGEGDDDLEYENELMAEIHEPYLEEDHDDGDDDEDDEDDEVEYLYDDDLQDDQMAPPFPSLGWDGMNPDVNDGHRQMFLVDGHRRGGAMFGRMDHRNPFPPRFLAGSHRDPLGDFRSYFTSRGHRPPGAGQNHREDDVNPLLRRREHSQENSTPRPGQPHPVGLRLPDGLFGGAGGRMEAPMGLLGELMEFLPAMGGRHGNPAFHLHITNPGGDSRSMRELAAMRSSRHEQRRDNASQEPSHAVAFTIEPTVERYQEESRMIFGQARVSEATKLFNIICALLTPAAMAAERTAKAEKERAMKLLEEERRKAEEKARLEREAKEAEEKAAREKKEAEEREAAERAAQEAALHSAEHDDADEDAEDDGSMEGVESTGQAATGDIQPTGAPGEDESRVTTTIRGEEVDVTELGIDPDYLAALPEEFREEVIAQAVSERRSAARDQSTAGESTEVFQEFLDALPEDLRREIVQQERQEQRRRHRGGDDNRRSGTEAAGGDNLNADMDPATILLTFPPELRQQVLMEQGEDIIDQLPPEMAEQARALAQQMAPPSHRHNLNPSRPPPGPARAGGQDAQENDSKAQRRVVVQMLDKSGVATLLRLMFIAQQGSIRNYLFSVFSDVCENRQNRLEVISTILQILQDGSTDMNAVERSFGQLSLKARKQKDKETEQKTPQTLKRTLTNYGAGPVGQANSETSPLLIVQQCLDLLVELCAKNPHIPWLFLTEHETVGSTLKRSLSRKGKVKESKAHKYAINSLLTLLDRDLVIESSVVMTHLADLLSRVTLPLLSMERRRKEAEAKPAENNDSKAPAAEGTAQDQSAKAEGAKDAPSGSKAEGKDELQKKGRTLQPPVIPQQYMTPIVRIFVARECSSKTFLNTITTIKNLSTLPGAKDIFGQELVNQARQLSENIVSDLNNLLPHINKASSGTEIQGIALAKFSPGASEQNKLLRVLTALDHLFDDKTKKDDTKDGSQTSEKEDLLISLYHNSTFSTMWEKLSVCLSAIRERENMLNVATILLPLIESLMVVCKSITGNDEPSQPQAGKDKIQSTPPPESRTANLFFSFTEDHRRILNELVRNNPKLMSGTFALLVKNPKVLDFDNKRNYFNRSVHSRNSQNSRPSFPPLQLPVRREHVFHDSFKSLYFKSGDEIKHGKLNIRFHGEEGIDAGGVTREWFQVLARQMFDPNYALFIPVSSDRTTFHPNKLSGINDEHLLFFEFIGRIIGKALYEGRVLDCFFSRAVYKRILGKSVSVKDMESFDPDYYKSLVWMLDNDITDIITETFSVEDDEFGVTTVVDLVPNGRDIAVTEENKADYVRLVVEHKLLSSVKDQMENFLKGFHAIIPAKLISIFNEQELELLISGLPDIDLDDWKSNTEYHNYNPSSQQIQWFWRAIRSFDKEERAKLLQFVTGTSKVPLNGFKELEGMNGVSRFNIHRDYGNKDRLPTSHTCFNQLDLPEYDSYDILRSQIFKAITQGSDYFGFA